MGAPASAPFPGNSFVILSVSVVGILATSLLLLAYYLFLTRCGFASWRRGDHDHDVVVATQLHVYPPEPARRGLEDAAIRRIPTFRYRNKPSCQAKVAAAASECAVCLSEFSDGERLRLLPPCLHAFHIDCIDAWLHATANCPLCRAAVSGSGSACPPHVNHVEIDIVTVLQADAVANANANADAVVIDIVSPSPADMASGRSGDAGGTSGGGKMGMRDDQCIDLRRNDDGDMLSGVQQPMRRSLSMDSCNDRQFYLALQKVLRQHHSAVLGEDGKAGESSASAAVVAGSRAAGRLRRSFFSFSQSRSSRSAVLPIWLEATSFSKLFDLEN